MIGIPSRLYPIYTSPRHLQRLLACVGRYPHIRSSPIRVKDWNYVLVYLDDVNRIDQWDKFCMELEQELDMP